MNTPRHAFSAALWAPENGSSEDCLQELNMYIADAIHVGHQLKTLVPNASIDRVLLVDEGATKGTGYI